MPWALLLWRKNSGSVAEVLENGIFLSPFHDSSYSAVPLSLEAGDRIILYTDGIVEAKDSSGEELGMDRFKGMVEENHALPADRLADAVRRWRCTLVRENLRSKPVR